MQSTMYGKTIPNELLSIPFETYEKGIEIELRVGDFSGKRFFNGILRPNFFRVLSIFESQHEFKNVECTTYTEKVYTENTDDSISYRINGDTIMKKTRMQNIDIPNFFSRISISREEYIHAVPTTLSDRPYTKHKKLWSYVHENCPEVRFDLAVITNERHGKLFQFEIEIVNHIPPHRFWSIATWMLCLIQNNRRVMTRFEQTKTIEAYNALFEKDIQELEKKRSQHRPWKFQRYKIMIHPFVKPINFRKKVLDNGNEYALTDKADGSRRLVFITRFGIYLLMPDRILHVYKYRNEMGTVRCYNTILDAEWIEDRLLVFDILIDCGHDVRHLSFRDRFQKLKSMSLDHTHTNIYIKRFLFPEDGSFCERVVDVMNYANTQSYGNDGIIFNNIYESYTESTIYKWKPPEMLTIDFSVRTNGNGFDLYVKKDNCLELVKFNGNTEYPHDGYYVPHTNDMIIEDGQLVEFVFRNNRFQPIRIRNDRDVPNTHWVCTSIWRDIQDPIGIDTIMGKDLISMRRFHNKIKKSMLCNIGSNKLIIDIGSGRGGDILKWKELNMSVLVVEPNDDHLDILRNRLLQQEYAEVDSNCFVFNSSRICILHTEGQDTATIQKGLHDKFGVCYVDAVVMFNSLTFFYKSQTMFDSLIETIDTCLAPDGIFIGIVMDGSRTSYNLMPIPYYKLKKNQFYDLDNHTIISKLNQRHIRHDKLVAKDKITLEKYKHATSCEIKTDYWNLSVHGTWKQQVFGNAIHIHFNDTIVSDQIEYLVDTEFLQKTLHSRGIEKQNAYWLENDTLSLSQNQLSRLYTTFVYKKSNGLILLPEQKKQDGDTVYIGIIQDDHEEKTMIHALSRACVKGYIGMTNLDILTTLSLPLLRKRVRYIDKVKSVQGTRSLPDIFKTEVYVNDECISSRIYHRCVHLKKESGQYILIGKLREDNSIQTIFPLKNI